MTSRKSVGSILKPSKVRAPLKQIEVDQDDEENTATSIKRKVSFSGMNKIKMYNTGATSLTVHQAPMFDEQISIMSDSSNTEKSKIQEKSEKCDGQITFEATNCTDVESNARVIIEYESPNDNMEMTEALSCNLIANTIYSIDNGSEYIDYKSDNSDGNMEMTEALHIGQVITDDFESDYSCMEMSQTLNDNKLDTQFNEVSNFERPEAPPEKINDDVKSLSLINNNLLQNNSKKIDNSFGNITYSNEEIKELKVNNAHDSVYKYTASLTKRKMSLPGTNKINIDNVNKSSLKDVNVPNEKKSLLVSPNTKKFVEPFIHINVKDKNIQRISIHECNNMELTEAYPGKLLPNTIFTTDKNSSEQINDTLNQYSSDSDMDITKAIQNNQAILADIESDLSSTKISETLSDKDQEQLKIQSEDISSPVNNDINSFSIMNVDSITQDSVVSNKSLSNVIYSDYEANNTNTSKVYGDVSLSLIHNNSTTHKLNKSDKLLNNEKQELKELSTNGIYEDGIFKYTASLSKRKMSISRMNNLKPCNSSVTPKIAAMHEMSMLNEEDTELSVSTNKKNNLLELEKFDDQITVKSSDCTKENNIVSVESIDTNDKNMSDKILLGSIHNKNNCFQQSYKCIINRSNNSEIKMDFTEILQVGQIITVDNESDLKSIEVSKISNNKDEQIETHHNEVFNSTVNSLSFNKLIKNDQSLLNNLYTNEKTNKIKKNNEYYDSVSLSSMEVDLSIKKLNDTVKSSSNEIEEMDFTGTIKVGKNIVVDEESELSSTKMSKTLNNEDEQLETQYKELSNSSSCNKLIENDQSLSYATYSNNDANVINTNIDYDNVSLSLMDVDSPMKKLNESVTPQSNGTELDFTKTIQVGQNIAVDEDFESSFTKMSKSLNNDDKQCETQYKKLSNSSICYKSIENDHSLSYEIYSNQEANDINTNNEYGGVTLNLMDSVTNELNENAKSQNNEVVMEVVETIYVGKLTSDNVKSELNSTKINKILNKEDNQLSTNSKEISNSSKSSLSFNKSTDNGDSLSNEIICSNQETNEMITNNVQKEMDKENIIISNKLDKDGIQNDNQAQRNDIIKENYQNSEEMINKSINIIENKTIVNSKNYSSNNSIDKITNEFCIEDISNMSISNEINERDEKLFIGNRKRSHSNINCVPLSCSSFMSKSNIQNCTIGDIRESPIRKKMIKEDSINKECVMDNVIEKKLLREYSVKENLCNEVLTFLTRWNEQFVEKELVLKKCTNREWIFSTLNSNLILTISYAPILNDHSFLVENIEFSTLIL